MNIAITGVNGFVGKHLVHEVLSQGHQVIGLGQESAAHEEITDSLFEYACVDLTAQWPELSSQVDAVIHLAGLAAVGPSFDAPQKYINLNSAMVTNLCEHYIDQEKKPRIVIISSGAVYDPNQPMPLAEDARVILNSPYAVSKILVENQAEYYRQRGLECIVMRPFNHIGPGQLPGFILPDFHKRIAELPADQNTISVGNIDTKRDYTDVRDIVKAYTAVAIQPNLTTSLFNVCSGKSLSGREILDLLKQSMNRPDIEFVVDQSLIRPTDPKDIIGNSSQLQTETGWAPAISIETTVQDFVL